MRKLLRFCAAALSAMLLLAGAPLAAAEQEDASCDLRLLFTTDIHSNVLPSNMERDGKVTTVGGFARLATAIGANRKEGKTLLLDSGDFTGGTMFQNFFCSDALELRFLESLGYDAAALGNHDFDYGDDGLRSCLTRFRAGGGKLTLLCSNLKRVGDASTDAAKSVNPLDEYGVHNYTVIEKNGLRVGLFALMGEDAAQYTLTTDYAFSNPVETAKAYVKLLREQEQADLVVLLSHCGTISGTAFDEDETLAGQVDGIDVILSGHSHVAIPDPIYVNGTAIIGAGTALQYLGKLDLVRTGEGWRVGAYTLLPMTEDVASDAQIDAQIAPYVDRINSEYLGYYGVPVAHDKPFAVSPYAFPSGDVMCLARDNYPYAQLLTDAYRYALDEAGETDVDVSMVAVGEVRKALYPGEITVTDVYDILGTGLSKTDGLSATPIVTACLTGQDLYNACETSVSISGMVSAAQIFFGGLRYTCSDRRMLLNRVFKVEVFDRDSGAYREISRDDQTLYKVAVSMSVANLVSLVKSNSFGLLSIELRDETGALLDAEALSSRVVHYRLPSGEERELKGWYALYRLLASMEPGGNGLAEIPERYAEPAAFSVEAEGGLRTLLVNPSRTALLVAAIALGLLLLLALIVMLIVRRRRKKRARS